MYKQIIAVVSILMVAAACKTTTGIFGKKTLHEQYADKLNNTGLQLSAAGRLWFSAAGKAINQPLSITIPYQETGYFDAAAPAATGYRFTAHRGDKVVISITKKPITGFALFLDLWQYDVNGSPRFITSADSTLLLQHEVKEDASYTLRLQPELLAGGEYTITIRTQPSLAFPVPAAAKPRIISVWGVDRDGGARRHEGIDIAAAKRTPLIACADGFITSTKENNLGGKVVFLRPDGKDYQLYYAHLDEQLVQEGQQVRLGDTIGLIGNTGNAAHTVSHVHFGIYTNKGAIDPLPFVDKNRPEPLPVSAALGVLNDYVRTGKGAVLLAAADKKAVKLQMPPNNTLLKVKAATASWYRVATANDSLEAFVPAANVVAANKAFTTYTVAAVKKLLDRPDTAAASKMWIDKGTKLDILATFNKYYLVSHQGKTGWIMP